MVDEEAMEIEGSEVKKWQLTAGAGVEGVVEIKIREEDFT